MVGVSAAVAAVLSGSVDVVNTHCRADSVARSLGGV